MQQQNGNNCQTTAANERRAVENIYKKRTAGCEKKAKSKETHLGVVRT